MWSEAGEGSIGRGGAGESGGDGGAEGMYHARALPFVIDTPRAAKEKAVKSERCRLPDA